tara:strand:+ start:515 stop:1360 length:846 start_codon:yes stop_codon:yes gene_type:complete
MKKSSKFIDGNDLALLARIAAAGTALGAVGGGAVGLLDMLMYSTKAKAKAKKEKEDIGWLSANPLEAGGPEKTGSESQTKEAWGLDSLSLSDAWEWTKGLATDAAKGGIMWPAAGAAAAVPAYLMYTYLQDKQKESQKEQLARELENAREDFRLALTEGTKLSADIDEFLETKTADRRSALGNTSTHQTIGRNPDADSFFSALGGIPGLAGAIPVGVGLSAAALSFLALNNYLKDTSKPVNEIQAMKDLQRRRKALNEIAPLLGIGEAKEDGEQRQLYVDY